MKDEYITPNVCSNYCPTGAQCGVNDCGIKCESGCSSGYLCLNYKCIREQSSSGGGSGGGSSNDEGDDEEDDEQNETVCTPTTCSALSRTCGSVSDGCGGTLNCGTCSIGYNCAWNGTCIKDVVVDCNGVACNSGEYCSNGACLLNVSGKTYFVATNGNDNNPGTFTQPWKTWSKSFHTAQAGDIVYFRGGTYYTDVIDGSGVRYYPAQGFGYDGTAANPIRYFNYPGEIPILDCEASRTSNATGSWNVYNFGIYFYGVDYVNVKGLHVMNVHQRIVNDNDICVGWINYYSNHVRFDNIEISNIHGQGLEFDETYYAEVYNSDVHDLGDIYSNNLPGGYASGFSGGNYEMDGGYLYFYGCRAWNCSDQGFAQGGSRALVVFENCWAYDNGFLMQGDGDGFKVGPLREESTTPIMINISNCIAVNNSGDGFSGNEDLNSYVQPGYYYNNLAYNNGRSGFIFYNSIGSDEEKLKRVVKNCIAYINPQSNFYSIASPVTNVYNSWNTPPNVTVSTADFVSLDYNQLKTPRKADGSLPDITFGHLAPGSDLIDAGIIIHGYHCLIVGSHPGEDCVEWNGAAPDFGPFESKY